KQPLLWLLWILSIFLSCSDRASAGDWALALYGGVLLEGELNNATIAHQGFEDSYLLALALTRKVATWENMIDWEVEGQSVKHFAAQSNWEFNGLVAVRWLLFPWDSYLDTSFAFGGGLSYATETPKVEKENHDPAAKFLKYLMLELAFSLPDSERWSLLVRIHHRSGAFGLFHGVTGASNALAFGVRYSF
ncbi:MAG: acyloxyacyl hydrolase, partial [Deltaproteobacteria bacterium]|nr:acyloxyacyl hydrolase [Deltaproteobacteria bacterium]